MNRAIAILLISLAVGVIGPARADLVFNLDIVFSGDSPAGWLRAEFKDTGTPGKVTLELESFLSGTEFVDGSFGWGFNFDPDVDLYVEDFEQLSGPSASITVDEDNIKADGDGFFDFVFQFPIEGHRFGVGDTAEFTIIHTGISAASFFYFSETGGGEGTFLSAAEVQGIADPPGGSGWIGAVPAPGAALLGAIGLGLIVVVKRKL